MSLTVENLKKKSKSFVKKINDISIPKDIDIEKASAIYDQVSSLTKEGLTFYSKYMKNVEFSNDERSDFSNDYLQFYAVSSFLNGQLASVLARFYLSYKNEFSALQKSLTDWQKEEDTSFRMLEQDTRKLLPQIISFCSLFVAVIGLIVANLSILNDYSLKSTLLVNLTFLLAIFLIFGMFGLLWPDSILKKQGKLIFVIAFPTVIIALIVAIFLVAYYIN